jgi:hypothetical protein
VGTRVRIFFLGMKSTLLLVNITNGYLKLWGFMLGLLMLLSTSFAENQWGQGVFYCEKSEKDIDTQRQVAIHKTLMSSNIIVRNLAGPRLEGKPHICRVYDVQSTEKTLTVTCDARPTIEIQLDGTPTKYPTKDGGTVEVIAQVTGNTIVQNFEGDSGSLQVRYDFQREKLLVTKTISSGYFGTPLVMQVVYGKE